MRVTGRSINRKRFRIDLRKFLLTEVYRDQSLFVWLYHYVKRALKANDYFNWNLIGLTMILITKKSCLNDHKLLFRKIHEIMKNNINSNQTSLNSESVLTALMCTLKSVFLDDIARCYLFCL